MNSTDAAESVLNLPELFQQVASELESCVQELSKEVSPPLLLKHKKTGHLKFRHRPDEQSNVLAAFLKAVRVVSLLNASLVLLREGYVQEVYILCRAIDEATEDITFFTLPHGDEGPSKDKIRHLSEFYQEQFAEPYDPYSSLPRDRVPRKKIHAELGRVPVKDGDPSTTQKAAQAISKTFSGFVHGAYVFIMEMYNGKIFRTRGLKGTPRMDECEESLVNNVYRSILGVEAVAYLLDRKDIQDRLNKLSKEFAAKTGCL